MRFINVISRKHTHTSKLPFSYIEFSVKIVNYPEFIVQVLASINWSDVRGKPWRTRLHYSVAGRAESQEGGRLAQAWTDWRTKVPRHQRSDEAPARVEEETAVTG